MDERIRELEKRWLDERNKLMDGMIRISALADKWNLECDELREDNKRLSAERDVATAKLAAVQSTFDSPEPEPTHFICHGHVYPWPSEDDYCGNVEDHILLYTHPPTIKESLTVEPVAYIGYTIRELASDSLAEIDRLTSDMKDRIRERDYAHDVIDSYKEQVDVLTAERDDLYQQLRKEQLDVQALVAERDGWESNSAFRAKLAALPIKNHKEWNLVQICTWIGNQLMTQPSMFDRTEVCKYVRSLGRNEVLKKHAAAGAAPVKRIPEMNYAVRRVLIHHGLTKAGDGVVEADLIEAVLAAAPKAALDAPEPELFGWMVSGVPTVMRGSLAEAIQKNEAKRIGGTCVAFPVYAHPDRIAAANRQAEATDWSAA